MATFVVTFRDNSTERIDADDVLTHGDWYERGLPGGPAGVAAHGAGASAGPSNGGRDGRGRPRRNASQVTTALTIDTPVRFGGVLCAHPKGGSKARGNSGWVSASGCESFPRRTHTTCTTACMWSRHRVRVLVRARRRSPFSLLGTRTTGAGSGQIEAPAGRAQSSGGDGGTSRRRGAGGE